MYYILAAFFLAAHAVHGMGSCIGIITSEQKALGTIEKVLQHLGFDDERTTAQHIVFFEQEKKYVMYVGGGFEHSLVATHSKDYRVAYINNGQQRELVGTKEEPLPKERDIFAALAYLYKQKEK